MTSEEALHILKERSGILRAMRVISPQYKEALGIAIEVLEKEVKKQCAAEDAEFTEIE